MSLMINLANGFIFPFLLKLERKYELTPCIIKTATCSRLNKVINLKLIVDQCLKFLVTRK